MKDKYERDLCAKNAYAMTDTCVSGDTNSTVIKKRLRIDIQEVENGFAVSFVSPLSPYLLGSGNDHKIFVATNIQEAADIILREGRKAA